MDTEEEQEAEVEEVIGAPTPATTRMTATLAGFRRPPLAARVGVGWFPAEVEGAADKDGERKGEENEEEKEDEEAVGAKEEKKGSKVG